jgi:aryl-alcohol dehydrogenase-like predicted oxidoreductase
MSDIPTRQLGRTGIKTTVLGYGSMELRNEPGPRGLGRPISAEESGVILNGVLDAGVNYIDTSIDYGDAEERIGQFISHRRDEYFLASKCGCAALGQQGVNGKRPDHDFSRENVIAGVEQSLRRMKTDYLDVVQFHSSPSLDTLNGEKSVEALVDLQRAGKIRFIGTSSTIPNLDDLIGTGVFDVFQIPYSGLQRQHEDLISKAAANGGGIVIRGGVARGRLQEGADTVSGWTAFERAGLDDLLDGATPAAFLLRFTISHPDMATTIVGTRNLSHLFENVETVKLGPLPNEVYVEAKRRLEAAASAA